MNKAMNAILRKLRWSAPLLACALFGCNTGNVQVSSQAPGIADPAGATGSASPSGQTPPPAQTAPGASSAGNGEVGSAPPGGMASSSSSGSAGKVYFERVLMDGNDPDQVVAISFASQDSTTTTPFGVPLKSPMNFSANPIFFPFQDQLIYLSANGLSASGLGSDSLASTALETMQTQSIFDFPREVAALAMSADQTLVAWIDSSGNASLSNLSTGTTQALGIPGGDTAVSVQLSGSDLLVLSSGGEAVVFPTAPGQAAGTAQQPLEVSGVSNAALSPDGSRLAYVKSDGTLYVVDSSTGASGSAGSPILTLESGEIYDFSWPAANRLSYWVRLSSGAEEVHVVDLSSTREISVAQLSVPASVANGVVCPAWSGDTLYFGDVVGGELVIERVERVDDRVDSNTKAKGTKLAQPKTFAIPPAPDEGFACPKIGETNKTGQGGSR